MRDSVLGIQPGNHFVESANPQAYLDKVANVNNFFELRKRLNDTIMKIIMDRFYFEENHRIQIRQNVKDQQYWKGTQALTKLGAGIATGATAILGGLPGLVNDTVRSILEGISKATPLLGDTAYIYVDGIQIPLSTELQEYLNTASLNEQNQKKLNELIKEVQQNFMEISRLRLQMYRNSALQSG